MSWQILAVELLEELEDTKVVIRIRKLKKNTMTKRKRTNNDLQNTTQKTNDRESHLVMVSYVKRTIKNGKNIREDGSLGND